MTSSNINRTSYTPQLRVNPLLTFKIPVRFTQLELYRTFIKPELDFQPHRIHSLDIKSRTELRLQDFKLKADFRKARMKHLELR